MDDKSSWIQVRVDEDLKDAFYKFAEKQGESPSNLVRGLMRQAVEHDGRRIADLEQHQKEMRIIQLETLSLLQKQAFFSKDDRQWDEFKASSIPEYIDELVSESLRDAGVTGDDFWPRYWEEIGNRWFTNFGEKPPIVAEHLKREVMDTIRRKLLASPKKMGARR